MTGSAGPTDQDLPDLREEDLWLYEQLLETAAVTGVSRGPWEKVHADPTWRDSIACLEALARIWPRPTAPQPSSAPEQIGRFSVEEELGRGASGIVYRARDPVLGRTVALKVPRLATLHLPDLRRRFFQEARAAATLKHPHLVSVHEAGECGATCFLVAEYCAGPSMARWLRERTKLVPAGVAAAWVADLAEAVQHAHDKGILHRDIKPGNILLEPLPPESSKNVGRAEDSAFQVKLTDFGLAKLTGTEQEETLSGAIVGTPAYMSPEQATGQVRQIGPPADVYSLGAVLYELLTGGPPFRGDSDFDLLRQVSQVDPVPPRRLHPSVPRDLETVCLKCLSKRADQRYATSGALARDLRRFLAGETITARPPSLAEQVLKWIRRHKVASVGLLGLAVALVGVVAGVVWHGRAIALKDADLRVAAIRESSQRAQLEQRQRQLEAQQLATSLRLVQRFIEEKKLPQAVALLEEHRPRDRRVANFAWNYWWNALCRGETFPLTGHRLQVNDLAWSGDGRLFAALDDGMVAVWDGATARCAKFASGVSGSPYHLHVSADGRWLAIAGRHNISMVDGRTFRQVWLRPNGTVFRKCDFSPDGLRLIVCGHMPLVEVLNSATGEVLEKIRVPGSAHHVRLPRESPKPLFAVPRGLYLWSEAAQAYSHHGFESEIDLVAANDRGTLVAVVTRRGEFKVLGLENVWQRSMDSSTVVALEWIPGSSTLLLAQDQGLSLWQAEDGRRTRSMEVPMADAAVSPSGTTVAVSHLRDLSICPLVPREALPPEPAHDREVWAVAFHPTARLLATGSDDETARIWDLTTGKCLHVLKGHRATVSSVAFSPTGNELLTASLDCETRVWNWRDEHCLHTLKGHAKRVRKAVYSPDGLWIATGGDDATVRISAAASGKEVRVLRSHLQKVRGVRFSKDSTFLITACEGGRIQIWNTATWNAEEALSDGDQVLSVAVSPDGETIATGSAGGMLSLWSRASRQKPVLLHGHTSGIRALAYSPDGRILASGDSDGQIRLWDPLTGHELSVLRRHTSQIHDLAFSPEGEWLASADHSGAIHLWDGQAPARVFGSVSKHREAHDAGYVHATAVFARTNADDLRQQDGLPVLLAELESVVDAQRLGSRNEGNDHQKLDDRHKGRRHPESFGGEAPPLPRRSGRHAAFPRRGSDCAEEVRTC